MEYKDIKAGTEYYVQMKVNCVNIGKKRDLRQVSPENDIKNTETAPKYDPCRKFRKGDIVRLREYNGRKPYDFWHKQTIEHFGAKLDTVLDDEKDSGHVDIFQDAPIDELTVRVHASYLELVTPVEELEPYYIIDDDCNVEHPFFVIQNRNSTLSSGLDEEIMRFVYGQNYTADKETVFKRAKAECARLNAEHRKEQQ